MGTHISKVRSVTLDKWSKEQVDVFKQYGNRSVNQYYEDRLDSDARPQVTDDYQMEQFIRAKYEKKRWVGKGNGPKPLGAARDEEEVPERERDRDRDRAPSSKSPKSNRVPTGVAPPPAPTGHIAHAPQQHQQQSQAAQSLLFEPHISAAPASSAQQVPSYVAGVGSLAQAQTAQQPSLSKDMLLSLYAPQPMAPQHPGQMNPHGTGYNGAPNYNVHLPTQPMYYPQQQQQQQAAQQQQMPGYQHYQQYPQQQQQQQQQQQFVMPGYGAQQQQQPQQYYQPQQQQQFYRTH